MVVVFIIVMVTDGLIEEEADTISVQLQEAIILIAAMHFISAQDTIAVIVHLIHVKLIVITVRLAVVDLIDQADQVIMIIERI